MKTKATLTIGIPAYNEAANIAQLLTSLLENGSSLFELHKIIVYSDGSDDATVSIVKKFKQHHVVLIHSDSRRGQAYAQNYIIQNTTTDFLLLLNADIKISDKNFINNIIKTGNSEANIGLVSVRVCPLPAVLLIEKIISWSHKLKTKIYEQSSDTIYLCHGRARLLSKAFYTQLVFPGIIAEDAYTYLRAKELHFRFVYNSKAKIYFRAPSNLRDHLLQSRRFFRGKEELKQYFDPKKVQAAYKLAESNMRNHWRSAFIDNPFYTITYIGIILTSFVLSHYHSKYTSEIWQTSKSSKKI